MKIDTVKLFCEVDDFVQQHQVALDQNLLQDSTRKRRRPNRLTISEMMTIVILFHTSGFRNFKHFYNSISLLYPRCFPHLLSYSRFVELMPRTIFPLCAFLNSRLGRSTGISFIDSTPISVCKPKRMSRNKVFKGFATKGKSTIGWFFGFKLHIAVSDSGELLAVKLTKANVDDRKPVKSLVKNLYGKLFGDKGYISSKLAEALLSQGIELITGIRKNMKNKLMKVIDKIILRKRSIIETINDQLKNMSQIEHSRHRSTHGFISNLLGGLIAYTFNPKKPSLKHVFLDHTSNLPAHP